MLSKKKVRDGFFRNETVVDDLLEYISDPGPDADRANAKAWIK